MQLVLPELAGKFTGTYSSIESSSLSQINGLSLPEGVSVRVPVNNVSMVDLTVRLNKPVASKEELFRPIREASTGLSSLGPLANVLCVNDDELVSSDFLGWQHSCIVDSAASVMLNDRVFKIIAWYGEWATTRRFCDPITVRLI